MTKFEKYATIFIVVCLTIVAAGFACKIAHKRGYKAGYADAYASFKPDTVFRDTTIYKDKPVPYEVTPAGKEMYPVGTVAQLKHVIDSLAAQEPDTTYIYYPIQLETQLFRDDVDSTYEAQITGWHVSLDWVKVNQKTAYITVPVPEYKYPSLIISPTLDIMMFPEALGATAGIAVDYWRGDFQWTIEAGYGVFVHGGQTNTGWSGKIGAKYNLIRK